MLPSRRVLLSILNFEDLHSAENFSLVGQASDARGVGQNRLVRGVALVQAGELVNCGTAEYDLVSGLLVVVPVILSVLSDRLLTELLDNLLYRVLQKALEGENLLGDQTVLLEVTINHFPAIILVNGLVVEEYIRHWDGLLALNLLFGTHYYYNLTLLKFY